MSGADALVKAIRWSAVETAAEVGLISRQRIEGHQHHRSLRGAQNARLMPAIESAAFWRVSGVSVPGTFRFCRMRYRAATGDGQRAAEARRSLSVSDDVTARSRRGVLLCHRLRPARHPGS